MIRYVSVSLDVWGQRPGGTRAAWGALELGELGVLWGLGWLWGTLGLWGLGGPGARADGRKTDNAIDGRWTQGDDGRLATEHLATALPQHHQHIAIIHHQRIKL